MTKNNKILLIVGVIILAIVVTIICVFASKNKKIVNYTVSFNSDGGSIIKEQLVNKGGTAKKPIDPVKEGYIFIEWQLNGKIFDFSTLIEKDITLKAKWQEVIEEKEMVTVKFDSDGGTTISNQVIEKGTLISKPEEPKKSGYKFIEWQLNNSTFDFTNVINEDTILIAKWEKEVTKTNNNNSKVNNTSNASSNSKTSNSGSSVETSAPSSTSNGGGTSTPSNPNNGGGNSTPTPTKAKYTVTFNSNGGSSVSTQTITEGEKASKPSDPTRSGYTFAGWTLNGNTYNFSSPVNSNITLIAQWTENPKAQYTVTFNSNGGSSVSTQTITEGGKASKPSDPTRSGYTFAGWTLNGSTYDFNSSVNSNITLVAKWNQKSYSIRISAVDDYSPARILSVYENGSKITVREIRYSDGTYLCSGSNPNVNKNAIAGETSFIVVLSDGTQVTARVN